MPSRFLFAATMFPDTLPPDATTSMGVIRRMTMAPKLMSLGQLKGGYASRLLGRNVNVPQTLTRAAQMRHAPEATELLSFYLRSRLWQRMPGGTKLPLLSGIHQHIHDINAVLFYAAAIAEDSGSEVMDQAVCEQALMLVEFHLANQARLYQQVLKGWFTGWLASAPLAWSSLRLIRPALAAMPQERQH